jgi:hypothetical protein
VGIDDVVAHLEVDVHDLRDDEVLQDLLFGCIGNDGPPWWGCRGEPVATLSVTSP